MIAGTGIKVIDIVLEQAHAWDADQIQRQHPHLTPAQVHSALAYYHDHTLLAGTPAALRRTYQQEDGQEEGGMYSHGDIIPDTGRRVGRAG